MSKVVVFLWQSSQGAFVNTCFNGLPGAATPLWQLAQGAVAPAWSKRAPPNVFVLLWQESHAAVVATCFAGLPGAATPSWQLAQGAVAPA
jgi:hypothetical protein